MPEFNETNYPDDEFITEKNDPHKVLIVPDDQIITKGGEEIIQDDEIITSPTTTIIDFSKYDCERGKAILHALRRGDFRS